MTGRHKCGGTMFAIGHHRFGCVKCTKRYKGEEISGVVDLDNVPGWFAEANLGPCRQPVTTRILARDGKLVQLE